MGDVFPEIRAKQNTIKETIRREEEAFNKTLDRGMELFDKATVDAVFKQAQATPSDLDVDIRVGQTIRRIFTAVRDAETVEIFARRRQLALA